MLQGSSRSNGPGFFQAAEISASLKGQSTATPGLTEAIALNQPRLEVAGQLIPVDLIDAIASAHEGYCKQVKSYLENHLPGDQYDVIVAGGTRAVIQPELNELFQVMGLSEHASREPGHRVSFGEGLNINLLACCEMTRLSRISPLS